MSDDKMPSFPTSVHSFYCTRDELSGDILQYARIKKATAQNWPEERHELLKACMACVQVLIEGYTSATTMDIALGLITRAVAVIEADTVLPTGTATKSNGTQG